VLKVSVIDVQKDNKLCETYIRKKGLNEGKFIENWEGYWTLCMNLMELDIFHSALELHQTFL